MSFTAKYQPGVGGSFFAKKHRISEILRKRKDYFKMFVCNISGDTVSIEIVLEAKNMQL